MAKGRRRKDNLNFFGKFITLIFFLCLIWYAFLYVLVIGLVIAIVRLLVYAVFNHKGSRKTGGIVMRNYDNNDIDTDNNNGNAKVVDANVDKKEDEFNRQADYFGLSKSERESCKLENMSPEEFDEAEEDDDYLSNKW